MGGPPAPVRLRNYLACGGFPEAQGLDGATRARLLRDYVDVAMLRDVVFDRTGRSNVGHALETAARELRALEEAHLLFPRATRRLLVLTADAVPPALPKGILAQPAYDWMLAPTA